VKENEVMKEEEQKEKRRKVEQVVHSFKMIPEHTA
jgi:hypothetical protein